MQLTKRGGQDLTPPLFLPTLNPTPCTERRAYCVSASQSQSIERLQRRIEELEAALTAAQFTPNDNQRGTKC